jgi:hypothetical protein
MLRTATATDFPPTIAALVRNLGLGRALHLTIQRQPDTDFDLPWKHGDYSLFEVTSSGIRVLVGVATEKYETSARKAIPAIAKQVAAGNNRIRDEARRVKLCLIVPTTTRFALLNGDPVLMLDPPNADAATAAHEMGHAIFHALEEMGSSGSKQAAGASAFRLRIADIYLRLSDTKEHTIGDQTHPAGLWIADPSQWAGSGEHEHPWDDPDEFFASAREAWQMNQAGFMKAIARLTKVDPKVKQPATELVGLLKEFLNKNRLRDTKLPKQRAEDASKELAGIRSPSKVEDTIMNGTPLDWLVHPENRPKKVKARPSIENP